MGYDWPPNKSHVPTALVHYHPLRGELAVYHGVLHKSHKVVIPPIAVHYAKETHQGHQGGESMVRSARDVMYWPGMQLQFSRKVPILPCVLVTVQRTRRS